MLNQSEVEFADLYTKLLEQRGGIHFFAERFAQIAEDAGVDTLIVCCFEDVRRLGVWCHRQLFSTWWEAQTGQVVEELPDGRRFLPWPRQSFPG